MKSKYVHLVFVIFGLWFISCSIDISDSKKVIVIQPFGDFKTSMSKEVYRQIKKIYPSTVLKKSVLLSKQAYYAPRNRYRADSLIRFLGQNNKGDSIVIGLTYKDISTTKGKTADWGVMGLGYCPGRSCVVSTFRLSNKNAAEQFYKVAIHDLGHTQGLKHCPVKNCFMRDAEGGNHLNEEIGFCNACKQTLLERGWLL